MFRSFPGLTSHVYTRGLFQIIRVVYDYTIGLLPIPFIYLALLFVFLLLAKVVSSVFRDKMLLSFLFRIIKILAGILIAFYVLWGFNYFKNGFAKEIGLELIEEEDLDMEKALFDENEILNSFDFEEFDSLYFQNYKEYESLIRIELESYIKELGYPVLGRVRVRALPRGTLLNFRTSGIYIPHALEGHFDFGLHHVQYPFTLAHEMAHGYGFTDESVCNFLAYIACMRSERQELKYSASLSYWRYLASNVDSKEVFLRSKELLKEEIKSDLVEIRKHVDRYRDFFS